MNEGNTNNDELGGMAGWEGGAAAVMAGECAGRGGC